MDPHISTMGPAIGFVLGVFFTWFFMYSKLKTVERNSKIESKKKEEYLDKLETDTEDLKKLDGGTNE